MKQLLVILFMPPAMLVMMLVFVFTAHAQPFYEYSYVPLREFAGGRLLMGVSNGGAPALPNDQTRFFFVKPKPYGMTESDVVSSWTSARQDNLRRSTLEGGSVLDGAMLSATNALTVVKRDSTWSLVELDASLTIKREILLPVRTDVNLTAGGVDDRVKLLLLGGKRSALVLINGCLLLCALEEAGTQASIQAVSAANVADVVVLDAFTQNPTDPAFAYAVDAGLRKIAVLANSQGNKTAEHPLNVQQRCVVRRVSNFAAAVCVDVGGASQVIVVQQSGTLTLTVAAKPEHLCVTQAAGGFVAMYISFEAGKYRWKEVRQQGQGFASAELLATLPDNFFAPIAVTRSSAGFVAVFQNAVATIDALGKLRSVDYVTSSIPSGLVSSGLESAVQFRGNDADNLYVLNLERSSILFQKRVIRLWWLRNIIADWWIYVLALVGSGCALWLMLVVRGQRRLLYALFEMPEADAMIILDNEGKLQNLNDAARRLLEMPMDVPMRRLFQFYCSAQSARALAEFAETSLVAREVRSKRLPFTLPAAQAAEARHNGLPKPLDESDTIDVLFSAIPIRTRLGSIKGMMLLGKDITEAVEKKRLANWAQLAHDLQTNLATIRLGAEEIVKAKSPNETADMSRRILYQVNLVTKRVRDIIDIGKTDEVQMKQADSADVCLNVRREFDNALFPDVGFEVRSEHILFECDQIKLERAVRNAVENGIRAMNNRGLIEISCIIEGSEIVFRVADSGEGMDAEVLKKINAPNAKAGFSTFRDKGGSGMGTMIMRHIIQLHGGNLAIRSQRGQGTVVEFRLPARGAKRLATRPLELNE